LERYLPEIAPHRPSRAYRVRRRLWREWCFLRTVFSHVWINLLLLVLIPVAGGAAFEALEPERNLGFAKAMYYTWSLLFAQAPEEFPRAPLLRVIFFLTPLVGLTVIIQGVVDLSHMLRDRRSHEQSWCKVMAQSLNGHVVLVGLGKLGVRTFALLRRLGREVVVIDLNPQNKFLDEVRAEGAPFLIGDARRDTLLRDAAIDRAAAVIVTTDNDLVNLEVALDARRLAPGVRVVLRMFDQSMADKVAGAADIHVAMSQSWLSAPAFATAALEASTVHCAVVGRDLVVTQGWTVLAGGVLDGRTVGQVTTDHGVGVMQRIEEGHASLFPAPDVLLRAGDRLLVQGEYEKLGALRRAATGL
jgi:voltage-gated potassium channel